ncbi:hypothetical protein V8E53_012435 [Lactarius tabidus]
MTIPAQSPKHNNNVSTHPTRSVTLSPASAARRCHEAFIPALRPTILCLISAIASIHFLALCKRSEATNETTANLSPLLLSYSTLLFSLFGVLTNALRAIPVIGIAFQDQPFAFVERPTYPSTKVFFRAQMGLDDSQADRRSSIPPWLRLSKGLWDCSLLYAFASVACLAAQVWLYLCELEPWCVQAAGGIVAAAVCAAAFDHLRNSPMPWTG